MANITIDPTIAAQQAAIATAQQNATAAVAATPDYSGLAAILLPIIFVIIVIIALIYKFKIAKKSDDIDKPTLVDPEKEQYKEFEDLLKSGYVLPYKSLLKRGGFLVEGRVCKWTFYRYDEGIPDNKKNKPAQRVADAVRNQYIADNFYLVETCPDSRISYFLWSLFGYKKDFRLIDIRFLNYRDNAGFVMSKDFEMSLFVQSRRFYDHLYIYSDFGKKVINGYNAHLTLKQTLKEITNYTAQMHYFDFKTARFAAKAREIKDLKHKSWKDREENLEKEADSDNE